MKKEVRFFMSHNLFSLANKAVREKSDIINLLLAVLPEIKFSSTTKDNNLGYCDIVIGKNSRITFTLKNEYTGLIYKRFSFAFPFILQERVNYLIGNWKIMDKHGLEITSQLISVLQSLSEENWFDEDIDFSGEALSFYENILDEIKNVGLDVSKDTEVWHLIRRLVLFEPGYLRYDFDDLRENPIDHPLHHLDVFFSKKATIKIGLVKEVTERSKWYLSGFDSLLDSASPCHFLIVKE